jgi:hypothetical protein
MAGLLVYGEYFEEYVLAAHELAPSLLMYPDFLSDVLEVWGKLAINGEVYFKLGVIISIIDTKD